MFFFGNCSVDPKSLPLGGEGFWERLNSFLPTKQNSAMPLNRLNSMALNGFRMGTLIS